MKNSRPERVFLYGLASIWLVVCLFPLWNLFSTTFSSDTSNLTNTFLPNSFSNGLVKITAALFERSILKAAGDTMVYTVLTILCMLIISSLAAYEFVFYRFPLKSLLFGLMMMSTMLPLMMYIIPLYRFISAIKIADTVLGIAIPLTVSALSVFILIQFLEDMPISFIESARIDGAGHFSIYFHIVIPLLRNGLITTTVLMFLSVWGDYLWPALVTGENITPISKAIATLLSSKFYIDPRVRIAAMLMSSVPPLMIYVFFQRHIISGIAMSGIKE
ncbi:MAG: carbohydrate ABC transporter permease [Oscillospiraceae bacterium]|nr:carbohydrate ABC transporter permease [Oscillospiraceae bacterium]